MTESSKAAAKETLRRSMKLMRETLVGSSAEFYEQSAAQIRLNFLSHFNGLSPRVIAGYRPTTYEANPLLLLDALESHGHAIAYPRIVGAEFPLTFHTWQPEDHLESGPYNIQQPLATSAEIVPDVLVIPLLAFDQTGNRLGYGGGYYDRTLMALSQQNKVLRIGLAFSQQSVAKIPVDLYDQKLDFVVTEKKVYQF